jgi:hypothetical protein
MPKKIAGSGMYVPRKRPEAQPPVESKPEAKKAKAPAKARKEE